MGKKLKILNCVQFYEPSKGGMQEVVKRLSEGFVGDGHEVTVATSVYSGREQFISCVRVEGFNLSGNIVTGIHGSSNEVDRYRNFVRTGQFDVVILYAAQQWSCDLILEILDEVKAKKIFVPTGFSALNNSQFEHYFKKMPEWLRKFDRLIFHSEIYQDVTFAKNHGLDNIAIIPNGASEEEFINLSLDRDKVTEKTKNKLLISHIGNHTGQKGHNEIFQLYRRAKLDSSSEVLIIGEKRLKARCFLKCLIKSYLYNLYFLFLGVQKKIRLVSGERENVLAILSRSDLFLFPSNIECSPIVLYEAVASQTPFLASDVGNSIEIASWTKGGTIFPTTKVNERSLLELDKSVPLFEELCNDSKKRSEMSQIGFLNWKERFTWEKIIKMYLKEIEEVSV